jgi:hypothetical protein
LRPTISSSTAQTAAVSSFARACASAAAWSCAEAANKRTDPLGQHVVADHFEPSFSKLALTAEPMMLRPMVPMVCPGIAADPPSGAMAGPAQLRRPLVSTYQS